MSIVDSDLEVYINNLKSSGYLVKLDEQYIYFKKPEKKEWKRLTIRGVKAFLNSKIKTV